MLFCFLWFKGRGSFGKQFLRGLLGRKFFLLRLFDFLNIIIKMKTKPQMGLKKVFASNKVGKIVMQEITTTIRLTNDKARKYSNDKRKSEFVFSDRTSNSNKKKKKEKISDKGLIREKIINCHTEEKKNAKRESLSSQRNKSIPIKKKLSENCSIEEENKNLKKTILILKSYINVMNLQFEKTLHQYVTAKQTQINV